MTNDIPNVSSNSRSKLKTFSLRPFSFIHAIVFERFWLDSASFLLFVSFLSWSSTWGVSDPRCVSLAVTWCTLFGDDELLRSLGWRPSWWTTHAKIEVKRLPGMQCGRRWWGKIVEDLFSSSLFFVFCILPKKKFSTCARCDSIGWFGWSLAVFQCVLDNKNGICVFSNPFQTKFFTEFSFVAGRYRCKTEKVEGMSECKGLN